MSAQDVAALAADLVVFVGLVVSTLGVFGLLRMPEVFTQLHAASKAVVFGVAAFLVALIASGDPALIGRAALVGAFLMLTTPVGAHAIALAAYERREEPLEASEPGEAR